MGNNIQMMRNHHTKDIDVQYAVSALEYRSRQNWQGGHM